MTALNDLIASSKTIDFDRAAITLLGQVHGVDDALRAIAREVQAHEGK